MSIDSVAVVFSGQLRGDARVWLSIRDHLILPHAADVYGAFWPSPAITCFTKAVASTSSSSTIIEVDPLPWSLSTASDEEFTSHFSLTGEAAMLARPWKRKSVAQYHILRLAFNLVARTSQHTILVRARTDTSFDMPVSLTFAADAANAIYLEAGRWELRDDELSEYSNKSCGHMPNDLFAYGHRQPMLQYAKLLEDANDWYPMLRRDPNMRDWRKYKLGVRPEGTFLNNEEGMLGYYLRWVKLPCRIIPANLRLCRWRSYAGFAIINQTASCDLTVSNARDPFDWCGRRSDSRAERGVYFVGPLQQSERRKALLGPLRLMSPPMSPPPPPPSSISSTASSVQQSLDHLIASVNWHDTSLSSSSSQQEVDEVSLLRDRSILLMGDSTMRNFEMHLANTTTGSSNSSWSARDVMPCSAKIGAGCLDCWACCSASRCPHPHERALWLDYTRTRASTNTMITFSWKPELWTVTDQIAFNVRFCKEPHPDLIYIGKGLHDACHRGPHSKNDLSSLESHMRHVEPLLRRLGQQLRECFNNQRRKTLVVLRTPYFANGSKNGKCENTSAEGLYVSETAKLMRRLHDEERLFGDEALVLDAHALTAAAEASAEAAFMSEDGHHYGGKVIDVERRLLMRAWKMWQN